MLYLRFHLIILSILSVICPTDTAESISIRTHTHTRENQSNAPPPPCHLWPKWTWSTRSWTVSINTTVIYFRIIIMSTRIFLCVFLAFCTNVFPPLPRPHMCHMWGCLSVSVCVCVCKKEERRKVKYKNSIRIRIRLLLNYHPRHDHPLWPRLAIYAASYHLQLLLYTLPPPHTLPHSHTSTETYALT